MISQAFTVTAAVGEYPPYTSAKEENARLAEEIVGAAFQAVGGELIIRRVPWKRAMEEVSMGRVDITFPWLSSSDRQEKFHFSRSFMTTHEVFFHRRDTPFHWVALSDLTFYRIGGTLGYLHVETLHRAGINVDIAPTDALNIEKVYRHRIDAFPLDLKVGEYLLATLPSTYQSTLTYFPTPLHHGDFYLLASKQRQQTPELIQKFNQGLAIIQENGVLNTILQDYD